MEVMAAAGVSAACMYELGTRQTCSSFASLASEVDGSESGAEVRKGACKTDDDVGLGNGVRNRVRNAELQIHELYAKRS